MKVQIPFYIHFYVLNELRLYTFLRISMIYTYSDPRVNKEKEREETADRYGEKKVNKERGKRLLKKITQKKNPFHSYPFYVNRTLFDCTLFKNEL